MTTSIHEGIPPQRPELNLRCRTLTIERVNEWTARERSIVQVDARDYRQHVGELAVVERFHGTFAKVHRVESELFTSSIEDAAELVASAAELCPDCLSSPCRCVEPDQCPRCGDPLPCGCPAAQIDPVRRDVDRITDAIRDRDRIELTDAERPVLAQAVTEVQGGAR